MHTRYPGSDFFSYCKIFFLNFICSLVYTINMFWFYRNVFSILKNMSLVSHFLEDKLNGLKVLGVFFLL